MATYLKLFTDYAETFDDMSDAEAGRLIKAILHYGASGEVRTLSGGERLVFGIIKRQIDRDNESADSHREAGKTGGRPKTKANQTKPNETKQNQTEPNFSEKEKEEEKDKDKEKDNDDDLQRAEASPAQVATLTLVDGTSYGITEADREKDAAAYPGVNVMQEYLKMQRWLEANPKNRKTRSGIRRFVNSWLDRAQNSARREPASQRPAKQNPSLNYEQRSYAEEVNKHEMPEWLRQEVAT